MVILNTSNIPGKEFESLGVVTGSTVNSKTWKKGGFKGMIGGEMKGYTDMLNNARQVATNRMIKNAKNLKADGIINVRYSSNPVTDGSTEVLVYGTAVKFI